MLREVCLALLVLSACTADRSGLSPDEDASIVDTSPPMDSPEELLDMELADVLPDTEPPDAEVPDADLPDVVIPDMTVPDADVVYKTCREYRDAGRDENGIYVITVSDGTTRRIYCDMITDGGGWGLFLSTNKNGPESLSELQILNVDGQGYLPRGLVEQLAGLSTQVSIRQVGSQDQVTSVPNTRPIQNLRSGRVLNWASGLRGPNAMLTDWQGSRAETAGLYNDCAVASREYPSVFWACGNRNGLHITAELSSWSSRSRENVAMQVWLR